jgi:hypothetical protein
MRPGSKMPRVLSMQKDIRTQIRNRLLNELKQRREREQMQRVERRVFLDLPSEEFSFKFFMFLDKMLIGR